tara:strand:- start:147 stop:1415 length:1269 start_codon:yes stop_codon:yes gene_type:complete
MNYKLNNSVKIASSTPLTHDHSVGFHDIRPFNIINNRLIVLHRYPLNCIGFKSQNIDIEICIWDSINSKIEKIDITDTWSWEQGSRVQWISGNELIYNKRNNGKLVSCIYDINKKSKKIIDNSVYSINKNKQFLNINFSRLWNLWKSYGYYSPLNAQEYEKKPDNDGVFICDLNNKKELILSINSAVRLCKLEKVDKFFFLCHPTFNPDGTKFISLLRFFNDSGALITYLICTDIKSKNSKVLARERVSHFEWLNNDKLVVWCRNLNSTLTNLRFNKFVEKIVISNVKKLLNFTKKKYKTKILSTHYHVIDLKNPNKLIKLNEKLLTEDGHPQISPNGRYLITDTYENENGTQKLLLYDLIDKKLYKIGEFKIAKYLKNNNLKCDLHPRWSHDGNYINIDSSHDGSRQNYNINIEKLIKQLN